MQEDDGEDHEAVAGRSGSNFDAVGMVAFQNRPNRSMSTRIPNLALGISSLMGPIFVTAPPAPPGHGPSGSTQITAGSSLNIKSVTREKDGLQQKSIDLSELRLVERDRSHMSAPASTVGAPPPIIEYIPLH